MKREYLWVWNSRRNGKQTFTIAKYSFKGNIIDEDITE